jgi:chromosome segregation ATPase
MTTTHEWGTPTAPDGDYVPIERLRKAEREWDALRAQLAEVEKERDEALQRADEWENRKIALEAETGSMLRTSVTLALQAEGDDLRAKLAEAEKERDTALLATNNYADASGRDRQRMLDLRAKLVAAEKERDALAQANAELIDSGLCDDGAETIETLVKALEGLRASFHEAGSGGPWRWCEFHAVIDEALASVKGGE